MTIIRMCCLYFLWGEEELSKLPFATSTMSQSNTCRLPGSSMVEFLEVLIEQWQQNPPVTF